MPEYTQEPSPKLTMSKFFVDLSQGQNPLIITVKDRKAADKLCGILCGVVRMSRFGGNTRLEFSAIVCEELDDKEKARLNENGKPIYDAPYKMVRITGKVAEALHLLKDEITQDVLTAIKHDIEKPQEESKEANAPSLGK